MHTLSSRLTDEVDYFADIEPPLRYCAECKRRTEHAYRYGYLECLACNADETALDALEV